MRLAAALGSAAALVLSLAAVAPPARAGFPGGNGLLVLAREMPAGDHTQTDLYTIEPDGSGLTRLTSTPDRNEFGPAWNAAGTRIAFWRTAAPFGPGSVWVMDADGSHQQRLTRGVDARDPAWNPAGTRLVFDLGTDLWSMRASDGGARRRLTSGRGLDFEPAWSPGGRRIAFTRGFEQGDVGDLALVNTSSLAVHRVVRSAAYDHQVAWSPDGRRLVYERDRDRGSSIFTIGADGSHLARLTGGPHFDVAPAFSPDGAQIAFGSDRSGTFLDDLWVMGADGTGPHVVKALPYSESEPDWQPLPG